MLTAEEKYLLLLEVSEAANSQIEIAAVLEAVVEGLEPAIHVEALAVTTIDGENLVPHAVYIRGVERRQGDSFADILARWMRLSGGETAARCRSRSTAACRSPAAAPSTWPAPARPGSART